MFNMKLNFCVILLKLCVIDVMSKDINNVTPDLSAYDVRAFGLPNMKIGKKLIEWYNSANRIGNPEELGSYFEGDIFFPTRNGLIVESFHWANAIIPFEVMGSFDTSEMALIEQAITSYHDETCIRFVPKTTTDKDFISIQNSGSGCWSSVGKIGGRQVVNIQTPGCAKVVGTIIHELMHACGFLHEQNREERDDYITILNHNIRPGYESNFEKASPGKVFGYNISYDYGSIMHYSKTAFSINGRPTIVPKKETGVLIGQRDGFSRGDIAKIRKMYNCTSTTTALGYKVNVIKSQNSISGGIEDIWSMIIITDEEKL